MGCLLQVGVNEQESLNWVEKKPVGTGRQLSPWGPQTTNSEASRRRLDAVFGVGTCWKDASSPKRPRRERRFQPQAWLSVRSHLPEGTVHQRPETSFKTDRSAIHIPVLPRRTAKPGSSVLDFRPQLPVPPGGMGPLGQGNILAAAFQPAPELPALKYGLRKMEGPPAS